MGGRERESVFRPREPLVSTVREVTSRGDFQNPAATFVID